MIIVGTKKAYTIDEVANLLSLSPGTIRNKMDENILNSIRINNRNYIYAQELKRYLDKLNHIDNNE